MAASEVGQLKGASDEDFLDYIRTFLDTFSTNLSQQAIDVYNFTSSLSQQDKLASMISDIRVSCMSSLLADDASRALNSSVFRYVVTNYPSTRSTSDGINYNTQGLDSFAFFGLQDQFLGKSVTQRDADFVRVIQESGQQFIQSGVSGWGRAPNFTDLIDVKAALLRGSYHKAQCDFWDKAGLLRYAWVN